MYVCERLHNTLYSRLDIPYNVYVYVTYMYVCEHHKYSGYIFARAQGYKNSAQTIPISASLNFPSAPQ